MKKEQKIIELRTAAKVKVAEIETKIAFARSDAAKERARLLRDRAAELDGLDAGSTERFDVLAKYRAKLADVNEEIEATVAQCKYEIQRAKFECEKECAAAEDDPEPEEDNDVTVRGFQLQQTVYCDGSQHSAVITARRILNKLPKLNSPKESFYIEISPSYFGGCGLSFRYINTIDKASGVTSCELLAKDEPEEQAKKIDLWLKEVEVQIAKAREIMRGEAENE